MAVRKNQTRPWTGPSIYDDAIDWTETPRRDYIATRDPKIVHAFPGETLDLWTLRPLRQSEIAYIKDFLADGRESTAYQKAFRLAVTACSDLSLDFETIGERRMLSDDSFETVPARVWTELGAFALERSELGLGEARRFGLPRGLPPIATRQGGSTATGAAAPDDNASAPPYGSDSDAGSPPTP